MHKIILHMHTVLRNQWVGVFILKEETCRLPGRAKGIMLHFFTVLLLTAINRISLLELDGRVCNLSWIHIGLDDKQLILICPDVDTSNTYNTYY